MAYTMSPLYPFINLKLDALQKLESVLKIQIKDLAKYYDDFYEKVKIHQIAFFGGHSVHSNVSGITFPE